MKEKQCLTMGDHANFVDMHPLAVSITFEAPNTAINTPEGILKNPYFYHQCFFYQTYANLLSSYTLCREKSLEMCMCQKKMKFCPFEV